MFETGLVLLCMQSLLYRPQVWRGKLRRLVRVFLGCPVCHWACLRRMAESAAQAAFKGATCAGVSWGAAGCCAVCLACRSVDFSGRRGGGTAGLETSESHDWIVSGISSEAASVHLMSRHPAMCRSLRPPVDSSKDAVPHPCMSLRTWMLMLSTVATCGPGHAGAAGSAAHLPRVAQHAEPSDHTAHSAGECFDCEFGKVHHDDAKQSSCGRNSSP